MAFRDYELLSGLRGYNFYLAASEMKGARRLEREGLVKIWSTMGGFPACCLTEAGIRFLDPANETAEAHT